MLQFQLVVYLYYAMRGTHDQSSRHYFGCGQGGDGCMKLMFTEYYYSAYVLDKASLYKSPSQKVCTSCPFAPILHRTTAQPRTQATTLFPLLNLPRLRRRHPNPALQPLQTERIALAQTPCAHRLDGVLNLPAIQLPARELLDIGLGQIRKRGRLRCRGFGSREAGEEFLPEFEAGGEGEGGEEEVDVDAGAEGGVDGGVEVCGEEDDALEVFEFAKEDCEKGGYWREGTWKEMAGCDLLDTSSFLTTSSGERFAMKTSASEFEISYARIRS